jgi:4-hydroxybenzoate polyprenyltransferase
MILADLLRSYAALIKSRIPEMIVFVWCVLVGSMIAGQGSIQPLQTLLVALAAFFIGFSVYIYNDIIDSKMDSLNPIKKRRPLPSGKVSEKVARSFVYLASIVGMSLAFIIKLEIALICLVWLVLFLSYSQPQIRLKKKPLLKESTPPMGLFFSVIMGAIVNGAVTITVVFTGIFSALFIFFGLPAFRDTSDIKEDELYGVRSLATILSWKRRLEMVILFILGIMTLTPLTYVNFGFNMIFPIVVVAAGFLALRFLLPLHGHLEERKYGKALKFMTAYFFLSQISMILGSFLAI